MNKILIVDDEAANLRLLERLFRDQFNVLSAISGTEALEILKLHDVAVIISDQRMPEMTGIDFLIRASKLRPQTVRIILTGYTDITSLIEAINSGVVYKYVTKPWVTEDLRQTVTKALQHHDAIKGQYELTRQNKRLEIHVKIIVNSFVNAIIQMIGLKSPSLPDHCRRTRDYAVAIGQCLNFGQQEIEQLSIAAHLHEAANVKRILKTAEFTAEEYRIVKQNFENELQIFANIHEFEDIALVLRCQHEHYDGSGYLEGLSGEQIPLHSRILAIANRYDEITMISRNSPHDQTNVEAINALQAEAGKKFDPEIVSIFCELESNGRNNGGNLNVGGNEIQTGSESISRITAQ